MRAYIPGHISELSTYASGSWEPALGYGITPRLLEISAHDDPEELAEQARDAAAFDSVVDLASPRRVVVVVDYPRADTAPAPERHPAAITLSGKVTADAIACVFVDEPAASADAKGAANGDAGALDRLSEHELLWFAMSELDQITD